MPELTKYASIKYMLSGLIWPLHHRRCPIFMFHRVLPNGASTYDPEMMTSTEMFEAFLDWASLQYKIVSVPEILNSSRPACAITFDDGWQDTYSYAFPLLQKHNATATVFVAPGFVGTSRRFWQERLRMAFDNSGRSLLTEGEFSELCRPFPSTHTLSRDTFDFQNARRCLLTTSSREAEQFVAHLEELRGDLKLEGPRAFMNWDEVREMRRAGIEFGSHTVNHVLLTRSAPCESWNEISTSRRDLEEQLGEPVAGFTYPWGAASPVLAQQVKEAGYSYALTTETRATHPSDNAWLLPRVPISENVLRPRRGETLSQRVSSYLTSSFARNRVAMLRTARRS